MSLLDTDEYPYDQGRPTARKRHYNETNSSENTKLSGQSKMIADVNEITDKLMSELDKRKKAYSD